MASAGDCTLAMFLLLLVAGLCGAADYNILDADFAVARMHETWMAEHGRVYENEAERARGFVAFKDNLKYIEEFNGAGEHTYTLGLNQFADLTNEEFGAMYAGRLEAPADDEFQESIRSAKYDITKSADASVPTSVDWRDKGAVGPVNYQGDCGSCWAMAVAATVEGLHKIVTGNFTSLSPQQLIDCVQDNHGCDGGSLYRAYQYIIKNGGLADARTYPLIPGTQGRCDASKEHQAVVTIGGSKNVTLSDEAELMRAIADRPVAVQINGSARSFQLYKAGIYDGPCFPALNHAVVAVGYVGSGSSQHWIVKNSWGSLWGEGGYIRMKMGDLPFGICGFNMFWSYPTQ